MDEIWEDITGFEGLYQISNKGRVKSLEREIIRLGQVMTIKERLLKPVHDPKGRIGVSMYIDGKRHPKRVHRMVADAFVPNPLNLSDVYHLDGNLSNNIASNLVWVTKKERVELQYGKVRER